MRQETYDTFQITLGIGKNIQLPYLDVLVKKYISNFESDVYRKYAFKGLGMKFSSKIPAIYKFILLYCLLERA